MGHHHYLGFSSTFLVFAFLANPDFFLHGHLKAYEAKVHLKVRYTWIEKQRVREEEEIKDRYRSIHRE